MKPGGNPRDLLPDDVKQETLDILETWTGPDAKVVVETDTGTMETDEDTGPEAECSRIHLLLGVLELDLELEFWIYFATRHVSMDKFYAERRVYVNPQRDVTPQAYRVHGISRDFLKSKPLFANIVREFLTFVGNSPMVMHNAPFDVKFLNHELALLKRDPLKSNLVVDTLVMARQRFPRGE
ncbi:hypothetical protein JTE90_005994 [Oedothorax gibbosus]|uniref:Exonuclease domain-containing protein n=1 Tax=Oedothorax gibbosus TaxID=931172 RepID=A0AAV6UZE5_9ARAC|nr:hypothetical protein JTE90_005994 [Oedothorax gibbosus]